MEVQRISILDVQIFDGTIEDATKLLIRKCTLKEEESLCISATGAHGFVYARKNEKFREVVGRFWLNLPDGMPGVWVAKLKGAKAIRRCYGPQFFASVMRSTANHEDIKHFFCGGNESIAEELRAKVSKKFLNQNVCGTYCPPFLKVDQYDYSEIAKLIMASGANVVWIGLSTPKQEQFADALARHLKVSFIITVGAAFDFHTDKVRQAPSFIQQMGLEWLFRLIMEPKRLYKRYLEIVPLFILYNIIDMIKPKRFN